MDYRDDILVSADGFDDFNSAGNPGFWISLSELRKLLKSGYISPEDYQVFIREAPSVVGADGEVYFYGFGDWAKNAWEGVKKGAENVWKGVTDTAKRVGEAVGDCVKDPGRCARSGLFAGPRGAFASLLRLNFLGIADRLKNDPEKRKKFLDKWYNDFGGDRAFIDKVIDEGAKHKALAANWEWLKKLLKMSAEGGYSYASYHSPLQKEKDSIFFPTGIEEITAWVTLASSILVPVIQLIGKKNLKTTEGPPPPPGGAPPPPIIITQPQQQGADQQGANQQNISNTNTKKYLIIVGIIVAVIITAIIIYITME